MEDIPKENNLDDLPEVALCHNCLAKNDPHAHFCYKCNTPLTAIASMDPIGSIWSRGDTWRKAVSRPVRPLNVIGMWVLWGLQLALALIWIAIRLIGEPQEIIWSFQLILALCLWLGITVLIGTMLFKSTRNYYRLKQQRAAESPDADGL